MPTRPNILFVFTDQQSAQAMSCAGNPHLHTPHMDALAAAGMRFTQAYCAAPVCGPSRSSLLSGRMPHQTGVLVNSMIPNPDQPHLGELFRDAGYTTGWSGRWHLPGDGQEGIRGCEVLHDPEAPLGLGAYSDEHVTDRAIEFIRRDHAHPFFLGVSLCNPHDICHWIMDPPAELATDLPPLPDNFTVDSREPEFIQLCRQRTYYGQEGTHTFDWDEGQWRNYLAAYYRFTEDVDVQIGRILGALRDSGLEEDTLVLFTSDHGEGMAAHRWVVKLMLYEEPMRVPFILSWTGVVPAGIRDDLVSGVDVLPTLCDYAGIEYPEVAGDSLRPLLENPRATGRPFVVAELHPDTMNLSMQGRMLRDERYKYIGFSRGRDAEMLFDLHEDPGETRNLAHKPAAHDELVRYREMLCAWCEEHEDNFAISHEG